MKQTATLIFLLLVGYSAAAQEILTLQQCYEAAKRHYPLVRQRDLIQRTMQYTIENASRASLPNVTVGGQATYQSEVTRLPLEMPGVEPLSKDQYRIFGEISQTIYHGGLVNEKKRVEEVSAEEEERQLDVELYQIQSRINEVYFGILLMQEQIVQSRLVKKDLASGLATIEAAIANGSELPRAADVIRAELLRIDQRIISMESSSLAYRRILEMFVNEPIGENTVLVKPVLVNDITNGDRPELELFDVKKKGVETSLALLSASKKPRLELFFQGGFGRPGLNMLENQFGFYYLGGVRFTWKLSGYYTLNNEREVLRMRDRSLDIQKETFLFNRDLSLRRDDADIASLRRLIDVDNEIISLRTRVRETAAVQLEEGVITSTDFIREVNAEDQAKQDRVLHEIQLLSAQAKHKFKTGQ